MYTVYFDIPDLLLKIDSKGQILATFVTSYHHRFMVLVVYRLLRISCRSYLTIHSFSILLVYSIFYRIFYCC